MSGWIQTYTGRRFYPLDPKVEDIDLADIAHALGNLCRFGGHGGRFYSVAQHSIGVAGIVPKHLALWGLMHDAAEAYLCDIPSPIKKDSRFEEYRKAEQRIMAKVCEKFGMDPYEPPYVKEADIKMFAIESCSLFPHHMVQEWEFFKEGKFPAERIETFLSPIEARNAFLTAFHKIVADV